MCINNLRTLMSIVLIAIVLAQSKATKCGNFSCEGNSECKLSKEKDRLECACEEGYVANITGNMYYCYQPSTANVESECLKSGTECGTGQKCNQDLVCENIKPETIALRNCTASEEECEERCCQTNEICLNGKCITKPPASVNECPDSLKCLDKCCAGNEFCSKENNCVLRVGAVLGQCNESQKCGDECCYENEICENGHKCMAKKFEIDVCPELQRCQDKCCSAGEICENGIICLVIESSAKNCPQEQVCLNTCCKEAEKCSEKNECIAKDKLNPVNYWECREKQKCMEKCCAENEVCSADKKCVSQNKLSIECPERQKCLEKCCSLTQICTQNFECEEDFVAFSSEQSSAFGECPLNRQCSNICCRAEEKCSKLNTCIPVSTIECIETDICGDKCCPINETCNEDHECVAFLEVTTLYNCPEKQQCADNCCRPNEVCNDSQNVCVARTVKKVLLNSDLLPPQTSITESNFDATIQPAVLEKPLSCLEDHFVCQSKCCSHKQTCSSIGECLDQTGADLQARDCEFVGNCEDTEGESEPLASVAYTLIGLAGLIIVLSFALFKVYIFRRSNRIVFN